MTSYSNDSLYEESYRVLNAVKKISTIVKQIRGSCEEICRMLDAFEVISGI